MFGLDLPHLLGMKRTGCRRFQAKVGTSLFVSTVHCNRGSTRHGSPASLKRWS